MSFWKERRVLVTGATGLLGVWLVRALQDRKAWVVALVRDRVWQSDFFLGGLLEKTDCVYGELTDGYVVERALNEYGIQTVFHLGAQAIVGVANRNPLSTFESNVRGTWTVLESARRCPTVKGIVAASSDKAYGDHSTLPYTEDTPLVGRYPYDASKSCADLVALSYAASFDMPLCVTRCGNIIGGGDLNFSRLVPGTIRSVLRNENPIVRSDGTFVRDYIHASDVTSAYIQLAERVGESAVRGRAFNVSNEQPRSVLQIVNRILELMDRPDLKPTILNEANHEIREQYLSSRRIREVVGWKPSYSLDEGLQESIVWYRRHLLTV
jgi:CDP-glucose 4,6-dehydratase